MKLKGTYSQLLLLRDDIHKQTKASPAFASFHKTKIADFFSRNMIRLNTANDYLSRLVKKYVEHDDKMQPMKVDEKDGRTKWVFNSEEDKEKFATEYNEFMTRNITIEI